MNLYLSNKKMSSTIELPYNEPLPFKKKRLQPSNFHTMNLYNHLFNRPYNEPLWITIQWTFTFKKRIFNHRITIQRTFTIKKKCLQPSNYHTMNLYLSNKKISTIELQYNEPSPFKQKMSSTIELQYNEPLPFKQKNVFNHRNTIQWTFTFQTKKTSTVEFNHRKKYHLMTRWTFTFQTKTCLQTSNYHTMNIYLSNKKMFQPSNFHTMNLYLSNKNMSSTIELPYKWTFTFQTKKCLQPSNYHTMNLYIQIKKTSSNIELPYNEPLPFKQKNVFNHRITIQWTFTFQTKNVFNHRITIQRNLYLSNKNFLQTIELPYNEPLPFKQKNVFNHRITIQWTFTFQTKKCLQPSNYHTMNLYLSNKKCLIPSNYHTMNLYISNKRNVFNHRNTIQWTFTFRHKKMSSTIELPYNETLPFEQKTSSTIDLL